MPILTLEKLIEDLDKLSREARIVAETYRPNEEMDGSDWVSLDGIATDLEQLARDARSDLEG